MFNLEGELNEFLQKNSPVSKEVARISSQEWISRWSKEYSAELTLLRKESERLIKSSGIEEVQKKLTLGYQTILQTMLKDAIRLLGEAPCPYAWVGVGSYGRGEILPYSDVECLWLFEETSLKARRYFGLLNQIMCIQIHCVNEPGGFHPDQYPEITTVKVDGKEITVPKTLGEIAESVIINCRSGVSGNYTQVLSALQGNFIAGDENLCSVYESRIKEKMIEVFVNDQTDVAKKGAFKYPTLGDACRDILLIITEEFEKTWHKDINRENRNDIKNGYVFFLTYLVAILKFQFNVKGRSTLDVLQLLINRGALSEELGLKCKEAWKKIQTLRFQTQMFYQDGRQDFFEAAPLKKGTERYYVINSEEKQTLNAIYAEILTPIYTHLNAAKNIETTAKEAVKNNKNMDAYVRRIKEEIKPYNALLPALILPDMGSMLDLCQETHVDFGEFLRMHGVFCLQEKQTTEIVLLKRLTGLSEQLDIKVSNAKANKAQCKRLYDRTVLLANHLQEKERTAGLKGMRTLLTSLLRLLQEALLLVDRFSKAQWFRNILDKGTAQDEFEVFYRQLEQLSIRLQLSEMNETKGDKEKVTVEKESYSNSEDRDAEKEDYAKLYEQQALILEENRKHLETVEKLHMTELEKRIVIERQLASMKTQLETLTQKDQSLITQQRVPDYLKISFHELLIDELLADGRQFSKIYTGRWREQSVSIKVLEGDFSETEKNEFIREIQIMARLNSRYITQLHGVSLETDHLCLVMEAMVNGSLYDVLSQGPLPEDIQKVLALDIACGLLNLHQANVLHRDLRSANVFIDDYGRAKLTDFGLSKIQSNSIQTLGKHIQHTAFEWLAPEVIELGWYTPASDVYSFGIILWEIVTGKRPFIEFKDDTLQLTNHLTAGGQEDIPIKVPKFYRDLIQRCWDMKPEKRPTVVEIIHLLNSYQPELSLEFLLASAKEAKAQGLELKRKAYDYLFLAAAKGHPESQAEVAIYLLGQKGQDLSIEINKPKAYQLALLAAYAGNKDAQHTVATMLTYGDGIAKNIEEGLYWYEKAAKQGDNDSKNQAEKYRGRGHQPKIPKCNEAKIEEIGIEKIDREKNPFMYTSCTYGVFFQKRKQHLTINSHSLSNLNAISPSPIQKLEKK